MHTLARLWLALAVIAALVWPIAPARAAAPAEAPKDLPALTLRASPQPALPPAGEPSAGVVAAQAGGVGYDPTSIYDQKGLSAPRGFAAQAPNELVDPFTGNLILSHTDLFLPGVAGLDLRLERVYNSKIHRNYAARASGDAQRTANGSLFVPPSPLGLGWTLHMGRLVGAVSAGSNDILAGPRYYERSDGSQQPFFTFSGPGCGNGTSDVCMQTRQHEAVYIDANNLWHIATADGLNITFAHPASDGTTILNYATEIRDAHGNSIQIVYHDDTIPGISGTNPLFNHFIDTIIDSAGRVVRFGYSVLNSPGEVRLTSINAVGRTYRYSYNPTNPWPDTQAFLVKAEPPAGGAWSYTYAGLTSGDCAANDRRWCELTHVTYPTGGTIDYTFEDLTFFAQNNPMAVRAVTRRVVGGRMVTGGTWTYSYNRAANYSGDDHTIVRRPDNAEEAYTYFGVGSGAYNPLGQAWRAGALEKKRLRVGAQTLQSEQYEWQASVPISLEIWGDPWIGFDSDVRVPLLTRHTITRGGLSWATSNTSFNEFNHMPRCTTEQGPDATRYHIQTFEQKAYESGESFFRWLNLAQVAATSYTAFTAAQCNPAQSFNLTRRPEDTLTSQSYSARGQVESRVVNNIRTDYSYISDGSLAEEISYQGGTATSPSNGFCTAYRRYRDGAPQEIGYGAPAPGCSASGDLRTLTRTLNQDGRVVSESDGRGTTSFSYDGLGRLRQIDPPDDTAIALDYDGSANSPHTSKTITQGSAQLIVRFDGFGRELGRETAAGVFLRQAYDALGRITFQSYPAASMASVDGDTISYDQLGRITLVARPAGATVSYSYGTGAHTVTVTEAGRQTVQTRRGFGSPDDSWLIAIRLPDASAASYSYLVDGQLTDATYAGRVWRTTYNAARRISSETKPESGSIFYGYDAQGNLRCRGRSASTCSDSRLTSSGADVLYSVDGLGRVTVVNYGVAQMSDITRAYDSAGNLRFLEDGLGTHEFTYTAAGRLVSRTSTIGGIAYSTGFGYDSRGNLNQLSYPSGRVVRYEHDADNRITAVRDGVRTYVSSISYHPDGTPRSMTYGNGITTQLTQDQLRRPDRLTASGGVLNLDYNYDQVGNLTSLTDGVTPANTTTFGYDNLDRLTSAGGGWGNLTYSYNAQGDRQRETLDGAPTTYTYNNTTGRLTSLSGRVSVDYGYDGRGNVISRGTPGATEFVYTYDLENRITRVTKDSAMGPGSEVLRYAYDGQGQRARTTRVTDPCRGDMLLHYDPAGNRILESTAAGLVTKEYIVAGGRAIAELDFSSPLVASPANLDFGDVEVGSVMTRTLTLTNRSGSALSFDPDQLDPAIQVASPTPLSVPANSSVSVDITFRPTTRGPYSGNISQCGTASGVALNVTLEGRGVAAIATVSPQTINFGDLPLGAVIDRQITVSSTGDIPLRITGWSTDSTGLTVTPAQPLTLEPGEAATFTLHFDTRTLCAGLFSGSAVLQSNHYRLMGRAGVTVQANLLGLVLSEHDLNFAPLEPGKVREQQVGIENQATIPLDISLTLDGAPQFSLVSDTTHQIAPGTAISITLAYRPTAIPWSPFGDHGTLSIEVDQCPASCNGQVHLIGNTANVEGAPIPGDQVTLALTGDTLHLVTRQPQTAFSSNLAYATRDKAGDWQVGTTPPTGQPTTWPRLPALHAGTNGSTTLLWHELAGSAGNMLKLSRLTPGGDWGAACAQSGRSEGWSPLAEDAAGNMWAAWGSSTSTSLQAGPLISSAGVCMAGPPPIQRAGAGANGGGQLVLLPDGRLALTSAPGWRLGVTILDPATHAISDTSPGLQVESNFAAGGSYGPGLTIDAQGGWHLVWPEILVGQDYTPAARYIYRDSDGNWAAPVTFLAVPSDAGDPRVVVDAQGGVHVFWSDRACAVPSRRKLYYATLPAGASAWQISDVSTPGYDGFASSVALALVDDRLAAAWISGDKVLIGLGPVVPGMGPTPTRDTFLPVIRR